MEGSRLKMEMKRTGKLFVPIGCGIAALSDLCGAIISVVIKVGMVGDSQIGKTSLMVKYVEGSFDEDYIQTLGAHLLPLLQNATSLLTAVQASISWRRLSQYGERRLPFQSGI